MKFSFSQYKQRGHAFAIIDEVDSILIDEARTPLIISGQAEDRAELYAKANTIIPHLRKDQHYTIDEKSRNVLPTELGIAEMERLTGVENLYDPNNIDSLHHMNQALRAHVLFKRDTNYVVDKGQVVIVDEHTGRLMPGRRWSDGLHGAIEAKEGVKVRPESRTLATITFQNYFRMYQKLSGMTGTADTEATEFAEIYDLDVLVVPTNRPIQRLDDHDIIYRSEMGKFNAVANDIIEAHQNGQPVLVGTTSVEKSEVLSRHLRKANIPHNTLNAKMHRDEAGIVAQAGKLGAITIATNMAGRGTDILLGGNAEYMSQSEVAKAMGQSVEQVADFAFLSGRPDLINIPLLVQRDLKSGKFHREIEAEVEAAREKAEEDGTTFVMPAHLPKTAEEAQNYIQQSREEFYKKSIELYAKHLSVFEAECKAEKERVKEAGGLRVIATERHESRRIDNQLRGRSGRQGDPGSSRFFLSLDDDLMRIFANEKMVAMMDRFGMNDEQPIEANMVNKAIENAQKRVEGMHFDSRKNIIEYDDVMNQQRKAIYGLRKAILAADPARPLLEHEEEAPSPEIMRELVFDMVERAVVAKTQQHCPEKTAAAEWTLRDLEKEYADLFAVEMDLEPGRGDRDDVMDRAFDAIEQSWNQRTAHLGEEGPTMYAQAGGYIYLETIDTRWKEHLQVMDHLREGIHLRGYGQKDPKQEYKKEGYRIFLSQSNPR